MKVSIIIIPAFNEEAYLPATLATVRAGVDHLRARCATDAAVSVNVIVVDNNSTDETAAVARNEGSRVVYEPVQGIARARNTGARHAVGDVLVFIDADVAVPATLLAAIHATMSEFSCIGGGVDVDYRPRQFAVRIYLRGWRILARLTGMVQGATPFCHRRARVRQDRRLRRKRLDPRERRLLPKTPAGNTDGASHGPVHTGGARATVLPPLRQVAPVACADLDRPPLSSSVPALESRSDAVEFASGPVDHEANGASSSPPHSGIQPTPVRVASAALLPFVPSDSSMVVSIGTNILARQADLQQVGHDLMRLSPSRKMPS